MSNSEKFTDVVITGRKLHAIDGSCSENLFFSIIRGEESPVKCSFAN